MSTAGLCCRAGCSATLAGTLLWTIASGAPVFGRQPAARSPEDLTQYLPPGSGKALVVKQCSTCHDLAGVVRLRASKPAWEAVVIDMVARGAPLLIEEVDAIIAYLGEALGPTAPPLVDVNSASRDELIKLPGLTPAMADRLIAHRESTRPFGSRDEVQTVLGLDDAAFGKLRWFVRVTQTPDTP